MNHIAERKFDMFAHYWPEIAEHTIEWRELGEFRIVCTLDDGSKRVFDANANTIYSIRDDYDEDTRRKVFGATLRDELREKHITQKELSEQTGISPVTISSYITGKSSPNIHAAKRIAQVLKCSIDDLVI